MKFRVSTFTGSAIGVALGLIWMATNAAVAMRFYKGDYAPQIFLHAILGLVVPLILGVLGFAWGYHSQALERRAKTAENRVDQLDTVIEEQQNLDRLKDEFIATASHELRTPLTAIRALAQLTQFEMSFATDQEVPEHDIYANLEKIIGQADIMASLVKQLLDTSRIDAGKLVLQEEQTELEEFFADKIHQLQVTYPSHQLELNLEETSETGIKASVDKEKIGEVLANLIGNAVKYSPTGSTIRVGLKNCPNAFEAWVSDEGIGVPAEDREMIFAKFFRSKNAINCDESGLGLGLYICKRIIERHGGQLWLDPEATNGSTFRFTLPYSGSQGYT